MSQGLDSTADRGVDDAPPGRDVGAKWKDVQGSRCRDGKNDDRQRECGRAGGPVIGPATGGRRTCRATTAQPPRMPAVRSAYGTTAETT